MFKGPRVPLWVSLPVLLAGIVLGSLVWGPGSISSQTGHGHQVVTITHEPTASNTMSTPTPKPKPAVSARAKKVLGLYLQGFNQLMNAYGRPTLHHLRAACSSLKRAVKYKIPFNLSADMRLWNDGDQMLYNGIDIVRLGCPTTWLTWVPSTKRMLMADARRGNRAVDDAVGLIYG